MADSGHLYLCATPIGNLADISDRLRQTLASCELVYAEDTRRTAKLLSHLGIAVPMRSLFEGNEQARSAEALAEARNGKRVAVVSDAGVPGVSDPGSSLVALAHENGVPVTVVPGPSAVTTAVLLAGFGADRFVFEGFLPRKGPSRKARIESMLGDDRPTVLFISPHRLDADLESLRRVLGGARRIAVTRELTKVHEEVWRGTLDEAVLRWNERVKGEITLVVAPDETDRHDSVSLDEAVEAAREMLDGGQSVSESARAAALARGVSRRAVYERLVRESTGSDT